jgi:transcriptional regulator with XRE-family HTH domain
LEKKLKAARESLYLTQRQFGDLVGLSQDRIGSLEQADVPGIDRDRVPRFAAALKMNETEFLKKVGAPADAAASTGVSGLTFGPGGALVIQLNVAREKGEALARVAADRDETVNALMERLIDQELDRAKKRNLPARHKTAAGKKVPG